MTAATKIQWRVQCRKSRAHKWLNKGLFETRVDARYCAAMYRIYGEDEMGPDAHGYGFGNTRVVRYVKGEK